MAVNTSDYELPPTSPVDVRFTEDISKKMTVPHHITVGGGGAKSITQQHNIEHHPAHSMSVPDRICVAGGGGDKPERDFELDLLHMGPANHNPVLLSTPPSTLTIDKTNYTHSNQHSKAMTPESPVEDPINDELMSRFGLPSSVGERAVINPQDELARIKKNVQRMSGRLYQLEEHDRFRDKRDFWLICVCAVYFGIKIVKGFVQ